MTILTIQPIYKIGTSGTSELDVCFLNKLNLFNQYATQTNLFLDTIELFRSYFLSKTSAKHTVLNPCVTPLIVDFKQHCKNLIHVFFKILTEYRITKINIYNPHFFEILISQLQSCGQLTRLQKYSHMISLFVNKYTWPESYYSQYLVLTDNYKYNIPINDSLNDTELFSSININYDTCSTDTYKQITINCNIFPFLGSISGTWQDTISKFIDDLYNQVQPTQTELQVQITLNIYMHLNTSLLLNLLYITENINTYLPLDVVYLEKYTVDFNTIDSVMMLLFIKLKIDNPEFVYDHDCIINYYVV